MLHAVGRTEFDHAVVMVRDWMRWRRISSARAFT